MAMLMAGFIKDLEETYRNFKPKEKKAIKEESEQVDVKKKKAY